MAIPYWLFPLAIPYRLFPIGCSLSAIPYWLVSSLAVAKMGAVRRSSSSSSSSSSEADATKADGDEDGVCWQEGTIARAIQLV